MTDKNGLSGNAFPIPISEGNHQNPWNISGGMSLRDFMACHAPPMTDQWWKDTPKTRENGEYVHWAEAQAAWAYFYADAMLKARAA